VAHCFAFLILQCLLPAVSLLQEEAAALETANVRAILGCGPHVEGVLGQLRHTQTVLDDLDESLKVRGCC
jgi:hypothetical protein